MQVTLKQGAIVSGRSVRVVARLCRHKVCLQSLSSHGNDIPTGRGLKQTGGSPVLWSLIAGASGLHDMLCRRKGDAPTCLDW